jgi:hypothetical protein
VLADRAALPPKGSLPVSCGAAKLAPMFYALVQNGKVISEEGTAIVVPWWSFTKTVLATAALALVRDNPL